MVFSKTTVGILAAGAAVAFSAFALFCLNFDEKGLKKRVRPAKQDRIDLAFRQELEATKDPATGDAPRDRLFEALAFADEMRHEMAAGNNRSPLAEMAWTERGPSNVGGRTRAILVDQNDVSGKTVWAGSAAGGLWKTTTGDLTAPIWQKHSDALENMAVSCLAQNPTQPQTLFFGTGEGYFNMNAGRGAGIWKSTNGGATWARLGGTNNQTFHYVQKMVVAPSGIVLAATRNGGLQRSLDGGLSWSKCLGAGLFATTNRAADIEMASNGDLFAAMGLFDKDGIYKSSDGGASWSKMAGGLPVSNFFRIELAVAPSDAGRVYALFQNSTNSDVLGIWATSNGGATWEQKALPPPLGMTNFGRGQAWYNLAAAVDPMDENRLVVGGIDLFRTSDGGSTWAQLSHWYGGWSKPFVHADQHAIAFSGASRLWIGNDGGIFRSLNASAAVPTFSFAASGYNVTQYYGVDFHPEAASPVALAGAQDNGTQRFDAADFSGAMTVAGGDGGFSHIDQTEPNIQIASYVFTNFFITNDNWATSESLTVGQGNEGLFINVSDYDDAQNALFLGAANNQIGWARGLGGTVSTGFSPISIENSYLTAISVAPKTANVLFVGTGAGDVFRIENPSSPQPTTSKIRDGMGTVSCIAVEKTDESHVLVCYSNYGVQSVFESVDGGATWISVEGNLPDMPIRWAVFAPENSKKALLATEIGVWSTEDLNSSWTSWLPSNGGLANVRTDMLVVRPSDKMVLAATHGRGLFQTNFFGQNAAACAAPTGLATNSISEKAANLTCQNAGNATGFEFRFRPIGSTFWASKSSNSSAILIANLTASTDYEWQVRMNCPTGWTAFSTISTFKTTSVFVCEAAKNLTVSTVSNSAATLKWAGVSGATNYDVRWRRTGTSAWSNGSAIAGLATSITGLLASKHYEFQVKTTCGAGGVSAFSPSFMFTTSATAAGCAAPHGFKTSVLSSTSAKIEWSQTAGSVSWIVRWKAAAATAWTISTVTSPTLILSNLTAGESYQFNAGAKCSATSQSPFSFSHTFTMPALLACQPDGNSDGEWIERVQLVDYQRVTGKNAGGYYCEMTAEPMRLPTGKKLDFEIEPGFSGMVFAENYAIWFDANGDGLFQQTPDEALFSQPTILDSLIKGQIELPKNTRPGLRHLRVMMRYNPIGTACGGMAWGECEDYLIEIDGLESHFDDAFSDGKEVPNVAFSEFSETENSENWEASASPNPFRESLFIQTEKAVKGQIFDGRGQFLVEKAIKKGGNEWALDFLPTGFYALVLTDLAGERKVLRVLRQ